MTERFDGNPENGIEVFLLFDQPVRLASDEEILSGFERYFDTKVIIRRFLPMTRLGFEVGDAFMSLREFSMVKRFEKASHSLCFCTEVF